jgi:hypothetical protein
MSHEERIKLINAPLPTVRVYGGCSHGGSSPLDKASGGKHPSLEQLEGSVSYAGREFGHTRGE